jgi:hypothetical protein
MQSKKVERGEALIERHHPVVTKPGWLPAGLWPELDERRDQHEEAVKQVAEATTAAQAIGDKFRAEDEARIEAYKTGMEAPTMTDPAERERMTAEARARFKAAQEALAEAVADAVDTLETNGAEWIADVTRRTDEAEDKKAAAARLLAEADQLVAESDRLRLWLARSSGIDQRLARLGHISLDSLPLPSRDGVGKPAGPLAELQRV